MQYSVVRRSPDTAVFSSVLREMGTVIPLVRQENRDTEKSHHLPEITFQVVEQGFKPGPAGSVVLFPTMDTASE